MSSTLACYDFQTIQLAMRLEAQQKESLKYFHDHIPTDSASNVSMSIYY